NDGAQSRAGRVRQNVARADAGWRLACDRDRGASRLYGSARSMADSGRARGPPRRRARVDRRQGGVVSKHADPHELVLPKPSPVPLAPRDPDKRPPSVGPKVKAAIAALLSSARPTLYDAAKTAGLRTYDLREALKSPHVRRYFDEERQAVIEAFAG